MAKKRKKRLTKVTLVKAMSRAVIGAVPSGRTLPDPKAKAARRKQKHKPTLGALLSAE